MITLTRALFPSRTQARLRSLNDANLPDTATLFIPGSFVEDEYGGGTYTDASAVSFPCRTWPLDAKQMETLVADQLREPGLEGLVMPVGQDLPVNAEIEITRHETGVVDSYQVKGRIPDPTFVMLRRAIIKRIFPAEPEGGS